MKILKIILILFVVSSVGYLVAKEFTGDKKNETNTTLNAQPEKHSNGVIVYYFHGNRRCRTCNAIEEYSQEAATPYINDKQVTWETVNIDAPNNKQYIHDFNLTNSGPVIVEYKDNKVIRWLAFDKVWQLVRDKDAFSKYIDGKMANFIKGKPNE